MGRNKGLNSQSSSKTPSASQSPGYLNSQEHYARNCSNTHPIQGIHNFGNTCFFNSAIQFLSVIEPLSRYQGLMMPSEDQAAQSPNEKYYTDVFNHAMTLFRYVHNVSQPNIDLEQHIAELFRLIGDKSDGIHIGYQGDAHEVLTLILEAIIRGTNTKKNQKAKYYDPQDTGNLEEEYMKSHEAKKTGLDSPLERYIETAELSVTQCKHCTYKSIGFQHGIGLSLPIPTRGSSGVDMNLLASNGEPENITRIMLYHFDESTSNLGISDITFDIPTRFLHSERIKRNIETYVIQQYENRTYVFSGKEERWATYSYEYDHIGELDHIVQNILEDAHHADAQGQPDVNRNMCKVNVNRQRALKEALDVDHLLIITLYWVTKPSIKGNYGNWNNNCNNRETASQPSTTRYRNVMVECSVVPAAAENVQQAAEVHKCCAAVFGLQVPVSADNQISEQTIKDIRARALSVCALHCHNGLIKESSKQSKTVGIRGSTYMVTDSSGSGYTAYNKKLYNTIKRLLEHGNWSQPPTVGKSATDRDSFKSECDNYSTNVYTFTFTISEDPPVPTQMQQSMGAQSNKNKRSPAGNHGADSQYYPDWDLDLDFKALVRGNYSTLNNVSYQPKRSIQPILSLKNCFDAYRNESEIEGWRCSGGQQHEEPSGFNHSELYTASPYLILHLKRLEQTYTHTGECTLQKKEDDIHYPYELDLSEYMYNNEGSPKSDKKYMLTAVICHHGSSHYGHYFAYVYSRRNKQWYKANDALISPITQDTVITPNAYILLYRRTDPELDREEDAQIEASEGNALQQESSLAVQQKKQEQKEQEQEQPLMQPDQPTPQAQLVQSVQQVQQVQQEDNHVSHTNYSCQSFTNSADKFEPNYQPP